jgi:hypothetical protein
MIDYAIRYIPKHACIDKGKTEIVRRANFSPKGKERAVIFTDDGGNKIRFDSVDDAIKSTGYSRSYVFADLRAQHKKQRFDYAI